MSKVSNERRQFGLTIVERLCRHVKAIDADLVYQSLLENGFTEDERARLTGALLKIAASRGWMSRTDYCVKSRRNASNLSRIFCSRIFKKDKTGGEIADDLIVKEYTKWQRAGFSINHLKAVDWERQNVPAKNDIGSRVTL